MIAGVVQRFEGPLSGTALFALDPGDALLWLQSGERDSQPGADPLTRFVDQGSRVLGAVIDALAAAAQAEVQLGRPALEERPLLAALLGTHAPSDTVVLSLYGEIEFFLQEMGRELRAPFSLQLLLEPKILGGILAGLVSHDDGDSDAASR